MLTLRSCNSLRLTTCSLCRHRFLVKSLPSLHLSSSFFIFSCMPLSLSLNPNYFHKFTSKMSSAPKSAFDVLMSKSRAPNSKKETQNSPRKRKTLDSTPSGNRTKTPGSVDNLEVSDVSAKTPDAIENSFQNLRDSNDTKSSQETNVNSSKSVCVEENKKRRVEDMIAELKSKIPLLKKKAGDFDPKLVACWERGERVPFIFLCLALDLISNETGRIVITDIVCNTLRTVMDTTPEDLVAVLYLLANRIAPAHEGLELGIGEPSLIKALAESYGSTEKQIKHQNKVIVM